MIYIRTAYNQLTRTIYFITPLLIIRHPNTSPHSNHDGQSLILYRSGMHIDSPRMASYILLRRRMQADTQDI